MYGIQHKIELKDLVQTNHKRIEQWKTYFTTLYTVETTIIKKNREEQNDSGNGDIDTTVTEEEVKGKINQ